MQNLERTLREYDPVLLGVIAARWDVDLESHSVTDIVALLTDAMLDEDAAEATWDRLDDRQRGAMQTLLGAGGIMPASMFTRLFGEIREMGPARLEREKPYLDPVGIAEALYYRGLIAQGFDEAPAGPQAVIYVPTDLAVVLPVTHTGFDLSAEDDDDLPFEDDEDEQAWEVAADQPDEIFTADTTLVDDMATLLAYLQVAAVEARADETLPQAHAESLADFLLKEDDGRLDFLLGLARALTLIAPRDGLLKPVSHNARQWLEAPRSEQVRTLAVAWRDSDAYADLLHTPGLQVESAAHDPALARRAALDALRDLPPDSWWIVDGLISAIKEANPDFQRPGGDYDSWYIRSEASGSTAGTASGSTAGTASGSTAGTASGSTAGTASGDYLTGFGSWDAVEGRQLAFILTGPLHWLGLADVGRYGGGLLGRLNAYGRAFVADAEWPSRPDQAAALSLADDGTAEASRRLSRYDRFQLARFTEWLSVDEVYRYRFSPRGLRRAAIQGITVAHIRAFLTRALDDQPLPGGVAAMLDRWSQTADADASIERLLVLRMGSGEALDTVLEEPALRRYLGARLGPEVVVVREGQAAALQDALAQFGFLADLPDAAGD